VICEGIKTGGLVRTRKKQGGGGYRGLLNYSRTVSLERRQNSPPESSCIGRVPTGRAENKPGHIYHVPRTWGLEV